MTVQVDQRGRGKGYCPVHEYDFWQCCQCCVERGVELHRIDAALRAYWSREGWSFSDRGHRYIVRDDPHLAAA